MPIFCVVARPPSILYFEAADRDEAERLKDAFPLAEFEPLDQEDQLSPRTIETVTAEEAATIEPAYTRDEALAYLGISE